MPVSRMDLSAGGLAMSRDWYAELETGGDEHPADVAASARLAETEEHAEVRARVLAASEALPALLDNLRVVGRRRALDRRQTGRV